MGLRLSSIYSGAVIHASATTPSMDIGVREIRKWHLDRGWCFSLDTEILTDNGWKNYDNLNESDKVFTYQDGFVEDWTKLFWSDNDVVEIKTQNFDAIFTLNHKMICKSASSKGNDYKPRSVEDIMRVTTVQSVLTGLEYENSGIKVYDDIDYRLMGCIVADGFFNYYTSKKTGEQTAKSIEFQFKKSRKVEYVKRVLEENSIRFTTTFNKPGYTRIHISDSSIVNRYHSMLCVDGKGSKCLPWGCITTSLKNRFDLIEAYLETDGTKDTSKYKASNKYQSVYSTVKQNMDVMQAVIHLSGMRGKMVRAERLPPRVDHYTLSINRKCGVQLDFRNAKITRSSSDVWSVDTGGRWLMIRRNGCVQITSNSDIGYHIIIRRDGTIEQGRPLDRQGAHTGGLNRANGQITLGICMVGGIDSQGNVETNFTDDQWETLYEVLVEFHDKNPKGFIIGHNEAPQYSSRGCPCFDSKRYVELFFDDQDGSTPFKLPDNFMDEVDTGEDMEEPWETIVNRTLGLD